MFTLYLFRCSSVEGALLHHGCLLLEEPAAAGFAVRLKKSIFICLHVTGNLHFFHALLQSQEEMRAVFHQKGCSWMSVAAISSVLGGKAWLALDKGLEMGSWRIRELWDMTSLLPREQTSQLLLYLFSTNASALLEQQEAINYPVTVFHRHPLIECHYPLIN